MDEVTIPDAGRLVGTKQVIRAARLNQLKCVYLAEDADRELKDKVLAVCREFSVEVRTFPSKEKLGELAGIDIACAVLGLQ